MSTTTRRGACQACHQAKTKCKGGSPCDRCSKFQIECLPHTSRQGQGKRRKTISNNNNNDDDKKRSATTADDDGLEPTDDAWVLQQLGVQQRDHYGLRYLIHSWISFAIRRRSFSLLSRASRLAAKLEISMDTIFPDMDFLPNILLTPMTQQRLCPTAELQWQDVPEQLLKAAGCTASNSSSRENRWIWVREMDRGMSRYLVSEAFSRDVASLPFITETWKRNQQPVVDIFLSAGYKHTQAFAHQINLFQKADKLPECSRLNKIELKTLTQGTVVVDQIACLDIVDMNCSYYLLEYVPSSNTNQAIAATTSENETGYLDLDELLGTDIDPELQIFLTLLDADIDISTSED